MGGRLGGRTETAYTCSSLATMVKPVAAVNRIAVEETGCDLHNTDYDRGGAAAVSAPRIRLPPPSTVVLSPPERLVAAADTSPASHTVQQEPGSRMIS